MGKISYSQQGRSAPFLLPDKQGMLDKFLKQFHSIHEVINWCQEPQANISERNSPNTPRVGVGLQTINWPGLPELKYNSLVWPTVGASRWGYFIGLQSNDAANGLWTTGALGVLTLDDDSFSVPIAMRKLCSRAITNYGPGEDSFTSNESATDLSLVVLVDTRYYLQYTATFDMTNPIALTLATASIGRTSWDNLILYLRAILGQQVPSMVLQASPVSSALLYPDIQELTRNFTNLAQFIDAVADGIGCRVVCDFIGIMSIIDPITDSVLNDPTSNFNNVLNMRAGQIDKAQSPNKFSMSFPLMSEGHFYCNGKRTSATATIDVFPPDAGIVQISEQCTSTCYANVVNPNLDTGLIGSDSKPNKNISNANLLIALQNKMADNWWAWRYGTDKTKTAKVIWDVTWNGLANWKLTGYDNYIEACYGWEGNDQLFTTRCMSLTEDFGSGVNYSQDANLTLLEDVVQWGYVTASASANTDHPPDCNWTGTHSNNAKTPATVQIGHKVYNTQGSGALDMLDSQLVNYTGTPSNMSVRAYPVGAADCLVAGDRVQLLWSCVDNIWLAFKLKGKATFIAGKLKTTLSSHSVPPAQATINTTSGFSFWGGYDPTLCLGISDDITVFDRTNIFSGTVGTYLIATYDECNNLYNIIAMGCP